MCVLCINKTHICVVHTHNTRVCCVWQVRSGYIRLGKIEKHFEAQVSYDQVRSASPETFRFHSRHV